jgi:hypothetical protein
VIARLALSRHWRAAAVNFVREQALPALRLAPELSCYTHQDNAARLERHHFGRDSSLSPPAARFAAKSQQMVVIEILRRKAIYLGVGTRPCLSLARSALHERKLATMYQTTSRLAARKYGDWDYLDRLAC